MSIDLPWPRQGDVLFSGDGDWFNACIGWTHDQWFGFIEGYKRGANILAHHVEEAQRDQDFVIYPIVFLYRQAIELALKHLICMGYQLFDSPSEIPTGHGLVKLWKQCRPILEKVWPDGPRQDLDAVSEVVDQFEARDPQSTVFRYPVTKEGSPTLPINERIDIRNFSDVAKRTIALLEACATGFHEYLQSKSEMEQEFSG